MARALIVLCLVLAVAPAHADDVGPQAIEAYLARSKRYLSSQSCVSSGRL